MRIRYSFSSRKTGHIEGTNKHKIAYPKQARDVIRISDVILEVLDARFIEQTRNREMESLVRDLKKRLIFIINKSDLVDLRSLKEHLDSSELKPYVLFSCTKHIGKAKLRESIKIEVRRSKTEHKKAHVGVIGYPNTGKSSLINALVGRGVASRSQQAGHTKGIQRVRFNKDILILDTPGVFEAHESTIQDSGAVQNFATIGVKTYDKTQSPDFVVAGLMAKYPGKFEKYYNINANGDVEVILEELGRKNNFLKKGGAIDTDRAARLVLKEWQEGKINSSRNKI